MKRRYDEEYHKANHFKDEYPSDVEQGVGELNAGNVGKLDDDDVVNYKGDEEVPNRIETRNLYLKNNLGNKLAEKGNVDEIKNNASNQQIEEIGNKSADLNIEQVERRAWYKAAVLRIKNALSSVLHFVKAKLRRIIPWF